MTPEEIIYQRRVQAVRRADELGNVSEAARQVGISRQKISAWRSVAAAEGIEALWPKDRRRSQQPNETPTLVVTELLTLAVTEPTLGARRYVGRLGERGLVLSRTTAQRILNTHGLGRRSQRVARAAAIVALTSGVMTDAARDPVLAGFCHFAAGPGDLVAVDAFYIGNLKGVGPVYQFTAIDVATRWAVIWICAGRPCSELSVRFIDFMTRRFARAGITVRVVMSDNGPEFKAAAFTNALAAKTIDHHRIPPRSPNHNAVVERFQGIALQECWRPAFHRRRFTSTRQLQTEADAWLTGYHHRRTNHGDYMNGRTPAAALDQLRTRQAS